MKKRTFRFVLVLMAVSAISAILFQVSWLRDSQELTKKNFEENVRLALTNTAVFLDTEQKQENIRVDGDVNAGWQYRTKDSLYRFNFYSLAKSKQAPEYTPEFYDNLKQLNSYFEKNIDRDSTFNNTVLLLYAQSEKDLLSIYERHNIDSIFKSNLTRNNIDLKYSYAFYNKDDSLFSNYGGEKIRDTVSFKNTKFKYQADQIPEIYLQLYDADKYVYKKLLINIIVSTILVLIVISSFAFALRIIMKQKKLSQIKTDFINNMTHELKTPLATISMATATIEEPDIIKNPETIKLFTKVIKEENERMNKQIERVLNTAKEDETLSKLNLTTIDVNTILEPIIAHNKIRVVHKNGNIQFIKNAQDTVITGDEIHIYQAINNLVDNAIKYSKDLLDITVVTSNKDGFLIIDVTDKGIGINKSDENLIFEKFYRVSTKDVHDVKGFGLGLNYVKKIVAAHHGSVQYKPNTIGSTFTIKLPLQNA